MEGRERRRQSGKPNAIMSGGDKSTASRKKTNTVRLKRTSEQGQRTGSPDGADRGAGEEVKRRTVSSGWKEEEARLLDEERASERRRG